MVVVIIIFRGVVIGIISMSNIGIRIIIMGIGVIWTFIVLGVIDLIIFLERDFMISIVVIEIIGDIEIIMIGM